MSKIELRTTQNVVIDYELATLGDRLLAFFIDLVIVVAFFLFLLFVIFGLIDVSTADVPLGILYGLLPMIGFMVYHFLSETWADGQSWGKKMVGIKVVRSDGQQPNLSDYLLRAVFHLVDTFGSGGILAAIFISSTPQRRRLGDLTANTAVIRIKTSDRFRLSDILRINTTDNYTPVYPEVKRFTDQDMLVIKTALARYHRYPNDAHRAALREACTIVCNQMNIPLPKNNLPEFLKTLLRDYIVLTR